MMQIEQHAEKKRLKTFLFYGPIRRNLKNADLKKKLERADVVLTTYSTLVRDYGTNHKPIDDYYWFRMVLDEAHLARNQSSQVARICCKVEASRRWAVTGTPLQNSLLDLGSLVKFLRVYPFDDPAVFHKTIVAPFGKGNQTVFASLRILVDCIALRRTKEKVQGLPKKTEHILPIPMTRNERKCYERLVNDMANLVNRKKEAGRTFSHHFLTGLIRIRRFCAHKQELLTTDDLKMFRGLVSDHPLEIDDDGDEDGHEVLTRQVALDMVQLTLESDCDQCGSCGKKLILEEADEDEDEPRAVYGTMIECFQILCPSCVDEWRKTSKKSDRSANYVRCDLCEEEHRTDAIKLLRGEVAEFLRNQERLQNNKRVAKQLGPYSGPSTKVQFLVQQLNSFRKWNEEHPEKITKA
jgi:SNF2 family DNA or RNA helicase